MSKTFKEIMDEARSEIKELSAAEVQSLLERDGKHVDRRSWQR